MKAKLILFAISLTISGFIVAQSSNVQIMDILVSPVTMIDTSTNLPMQTNGENLAILCKTNDLASVENVIILFGTSENLGDVITVNAEIVENDGAYYLSIGNEMQKLQENVISATIELSQQQLEAYNFITMYVIDNAEQQSNHLVFTK
ncbi:MAG TPA: hypothetical protein PLG05_06825 [Bacteroidales bacterium]|nr:hypothetical protein [Bacteroidales bacterium]HOR60604.1 hypothetical protein [Bacteroidales bacterium]HPL04873.1 hypothetical protein [Bacteroidales bacterium]